MRVQVSLESNFTLDFGNVRVMFERRSSILETLFNVLKLDNSGAGCSKGVYSLKGG